MVRLCHGGRGSSVTFLLVIGFEVRVRGVLGEAAKKEPCLPQRFSHGAASAARARASPGSGEYWAVGSVHNRRLDGVQGTEPPRLLDEIDNATDITTTAKTHMNRLFGEVLLFTVLSFFFTLITAMSVVDCLLARKGKSIAMVEACADAGVEVSEDDCEGLSAARPIPTHGAAKRFKRCP